MTKLAPVDAAAKPPATLRTRIATGSGLLLLAAALALSFPGVRAVRAGELDMTPVGPGDYAGLPAATNRNPAAEPAAAEACQDAGAEPERTKAVVRIPAAGPAIDPDFVVLNGRGYNYGPVEPGAEAQAQQLERALRTRRTD